jgi:hypothetical protein
MAFEDVNILVRKDAGATEVRWRQDAAIGSLVTFSLSDTRDVRTFEWKIIGRPEGSGAGGGGPEPITLTTAQTCSITLDVSGAYIVACTINGGSPNQTFKTAGVAILCTITDPVGRPLRYLGGYETDEDLADPLVAQGWIKMLDRWLHALESYITSGGVDTFKVAVDAADAASGDADFAEIKITQGAGATVTKGTGSNGKALIIGAKGDHKVAIDSADEASGNADYAEIKITHGSGIAISKVTGSHGKALQIACTVSPGVDDHKVSTSDADEAAGKAGRLANKARGDEVTITSRIDTDSTYGEQVVFSTIPQNVEQIGQELYAAHLTDPALHVSVASLYHLVVGGGSNFVAFFDHDWAPWEELRPGVYQATTAGRSLWIALNGGVTPTRGMRTLVVNPTAYPTNDADKPRSGIYVWDDPGIDENFNNTYAVLRRADDANSSEEFSPGCVVRVDGGTYAGKFFRLTTSRPIMLDTTELSWEQLDTYAVVESDNLLTASQLAAASETQHEATLSAIISAPGEWLTFSTLPGTPGVDQYPAGRTEWWVYARLDAEGDSGSTVWLECQLVRDPGGANEVIRFENTSPVSWSDYVIYKTHKDSDTAAELAGDDIAMRVRAVSNSVVLAASVVVRWSDPGHRTKVVTPLSLAVNGTLDHQALTVASRGFSAEETADASAYRHPMRAIAPGRILWDEGSTVATASGLLTLPAKSNAVRVSGSDTLLGIATSGFTPGTIIYLESAESRLIANGGTPGSGYDPLSFHVSMGMTASPSVFLWPANSGMALKLTGGGNWLVLSAPWLEPQRALWPSMVSVTINTTTAPGLLELPLGCPGVIYVTGTELRAVTVKDANGNFQAGPLAGIKLFFANNCTLYHLDALSGWDAGLAARAAKLDLLPPEGSTGDAANVWVPARRTYRLQRDASDLLWIPEVSQ